MSDGSVVAALIVVGAMVLTNILIAAFTYGRWYQLVKELCRRVTRLEKMHNLDSDKT